MKENIKFVGKMLVVIALVLVILYPINLLYKSGLTYQGSNEGIDEFANIPMEIEYANFGPSIGMNCFDYSALEAEGKTCFNFALSMQNLYHDYEIYKEYADHLAPGAVVALPLTNISFCFNLNGDSSPRYYKILGSDAIKGYTLENDVSAKYVPVYGKGSSLIRDVLSGALDRVMVNIVKRSETSDETAAGENATPDWATVLKRDSAAQVVSLTNGNMLAYESCIAEAEEILTNWIKEMQAAGLRPVVVIAPLWPDLVTGFEPEIFHRCYTEPLRRVLEATGVPCMDFTDFENQAYLDYCNTPEYFSNSNHVSDAGAAAFMELYVEYVNENLLP